MGPKEALKESVLLAKTGEKSPKFQGKCFKCGKQGHRKSDCRSKKGEKQENQEKSPSTGPLATPGGGRGLSPGPGKSTEKPIANASSAETSWMALAEPTYSKDLLWVIDSGSSRHMTYLREAFTEYRVLDTPILVTTANGARIPAIAEGTVLLQVALGASVRTIKLTGVLYVPKLAGSLISVLQLQDKGITIRTTTGSTGKKLLIKFQGAVIGVASRLGRAYALDSISQGTDIGLKATTAPENQASLWHCRFGHLSPTSLKLEHTVSIGLKEPIRALQEPCEPCIKAKTVRVVNQKAPERATAPLERIHSDFWGPYSVPILEGDTYILTFTDDYTRKSWVYLTKTRK
jgi:hypothetical protein